MHVGLDRAHRALDDQRDADRGGEVEDDVGLVDQLGDHGIVLGGVDRVLEAGMALEVADVVDPARRQVVEDVDRVAVLEQHIAEMRADEAGAAGDQKAHRGSQITWR